MPVGPQGQAGDAFAVKVRMDSQEHTDDSAVLEETFLEALSLKRKLSMENLIWESHHLSLPHNVCLPVGTKSALTCRAMTCRVNRGTIPSLTFREVEVCVAIQHES